MNQADVIIVGGGPAGSACAWHLVQSGVDCLVLDQRAFPRFKPCAGWITPELVRTLQMDPDNYPYSFTTFASFEVSLRGLKFRLPTLQHAIRRYEFDDWLLRRSGAPVRTHTVKSIERSRDGYVIDHAFRAPILVGAGGTHCPVYRTFFQALSPRPPGKLVIAQEEEFAYQVNDDRCYLWFFENHLPGYAWYVPKANGFINVGLGGVARTMKNHADSLKRHWSLLVDKLEALGLVRGHEFKPQGHSYYLRPRRIQPRIDNAFVVGDAAGLATLDLGEGIRTAVESGLLAAKAIVKGDDYSLASLPRYSWVSLLRALF